MRAFVAIDIGEAIRARIGEEVLRLRDLAPAARWTAASAVHLTLVFLGEVDEGDTDAVVAAARAVAERHGPLTLAARGAGVFGGPRRARVLWVGLEGEVSGLASLQRELDRALAKYGPAREERGFHPHLTLARARAPGGDPRLAACAEALADVSLGEMRAEEIVLYRSELGGGPARHTALARLALSSRPAG